MVDERVSTVDEALRLEVTKVKVADERVEEGCGRLRLINWEQQIGS